MEIGTFREKCEGVVLLNELPILSGLRQKAAGCYAAFGICPGGDVVALDLDGNVCCLSADVNDGSHVCDDGDSSCWLKARPVNILEVIGLLSRFMLEKLSQRAFRAKMKLERR